MSQNLKTPEMFFDCGVINLETDTNEYNYVRLESSEYRPSENFEINGARFSDEIPVALMGQFATKNVVRYEEVNNISLSSRYGLESSRLSRHMIESALEVREYIENDRDMVLDSLYEAGFYESLAPKGLMQMVAGIYTKFDPSRDGLRSVFAYDARFNDFALALRRTTAENKAFDKDHYVSPLHRIAEKSCPQTRSILARGAAASIMPEPDAMVDSRRADQINQ